MSNGGGPRGVVGRQGGATDLQSQVSLGDQVLGGFHLRRVGRALSGRTLVAAGGDARWSLGTGGSTWGSFDTGRSLATWQILAGAAGRQALTNWRSTGQGVACWGSWWWLWTTSRACWGPSCRILWSRGHSSAETWGSFQDQPRSWKE